MDDDPVALAAQLVAIESVNPSLAPSGSGEQGVADFCAAWLATRGFDVLAVATTPGRPSVIATFRGTGGGRSLMLNGHLDTVSVSSPDQLVPVIRDGNLYGRGAFDTKGGVAAVMVAAARAAGNLRGDIIVTLVADEEFGSTGTEGVLAQLGRSGVTADAAIVTEPSGLELTLAHRGFAWFEVEVTGLAAHGSMPEQGIDAIAQAARVMAALDVLRAELEGRPRHPVLGYGTVRVATINGGVDAATVAPSCTLTADVAGSAATRGEPFWTDAALVLEAGIPCLVIGVDGGGAHADEEWATTASIEQLAEVLERSIATYCS